ncbi:nucleotide kinase [Tissierella sp. P1]|jgi:broad-specificity NMP kinase|uniref:AAA family ATPase n=1 Tax=unclassified Tissierella TaxID=2638726 RepID=UPI000BA04D5C|nr:AAA family ATPase [Tissierella sp. P1]MDU5080112.1 AAA family ATPase [Bacillota bacterium]OZV13248.1 nucleotide kinase [Tissierella sp. P1]
MKKLIIINGVPGVGKTTICRELYKSISNSVWLDGDWCWMMNPFVVNEENKKMVEDNINFLLRSYLNNSSYKYVIFNWVIGNEKIFETILSKLDDLEFQLYKISLISSPKTLKERMLEDGRTEEQIENSINRLKFYEDMDTFKIDITNMSVRNVVSKILEMIK